jgi:hypothetical protein
MRVRREPDVLFRGVLGECIEGDGQRLVSDREGLGQTDRPQLSTSRGVRALEHPLAAPAGVSFTGRVARSNSSTPSISSTARAC